MKRLNTVVNKPWGKFYDIAQEKGKWHLKLINIKRGHRISLQKHFNRSELWIIVEGKVQIEKGKRIYILDSKKSIFIKKREVHRIKALKNSIVAEISFGSHNEKDIVRFADDYGRK